MTNRTNTNRTAATATPKKGTKAPGARRSGAPRAEKKATTATAAQPADGDRHGNVNNPEGKSCYGAARHLDALGGSVPSGVRRVRRARNGSLILLVETAAFGLDASDGSHATVCHTHGTNVVGATRKAAYTAMSNSADWCADCKKAARTTKKAATNRKVAK
jgi:GMP synthase-like glutamine amidotransferase